MACKLFVFAALVAVATAAPQAYHQMEPAYDHSAPAHPQVPHHAVEVQYESKPEYHFSYEVNDEHTGDVKSQHETRNGDVVEGSYSLIEADGTRRIVDYKADDHSGFTAVVRKEGEARPVAVPHKTYPAAPVPPKYVADPMTEAPESYAAPAAPETGYTNVPSYGYQH